MIKNHGRKGPRGIEPRTQGSKPCVLTITPWSLKPILYINILFKYFL